MRLACKGRPVKTSTINRDVANLKAMLKKALDHSKIESNLIRWVKPLEENNVRERVLCQEEFESLFVHCTASLKGLVLIAYYLPMRQGEIFCFKNGMHFSEKWGEKSWKTFGRNILSM